MRDEKIAHRCGAKQISKSKCTKHLSFGALLEVVMSKKCTPLWCEAHFEVKLYKTLQLRSTFRSCDVEKVHAVVARSTSRSQNVQRTTCSRHFWTLKRRFAWQAQGIVHLVKVSKTWGFSRISKNDGRRGTFEEDLQRCIFPGRRNTRDMFIRAVRRSGRPFFQRGVACWSIRSSGLLRWFLRDRCSTSYDLASLFRGRRNTLETWTGKIAKRIGTRPSALHSTLHFWRKSRRIVSFWCCQGQKLRKSRRIAAFSSLQVDRQTGRQTDRWDEMRWDEMRWDEIR